MRTSRTLGALLLGVVAAMTLAGCVRLPTSGPIEEAGENGQSGRRVTCCYLPNPPKEGESPADIVKHFLDAMTATPMQTSVAREFLTAAAAQSWRPDDSVIVYEGTSVPRGAKQVAVTLQDAFTLDARGAFDGAYDAPGDTVQFSMAQEDGEWRIDELPDALIVPRVFVEDHFVAVNTYFFDPTAKILVPEPVRVPQGEGFLTTLVQSLLQGPREDLADVERSFLPASLKAGLSVGVDQRGVVDLELQGDASAMTEEDAALAAAQIAWTLKQDPSVRAIKLTADGRPLPGLSADVSLETGVEFEPTGFGASSELFALRQGRILRGFPGAWKAVSPEDADLPLRGFAVSLDGTRIAGVSDDGTAALTGPVDGDADQLLPVVSGATDLLRPAWDFSGRVWLLDRTPSGAALSVLERGSVRSVDAPGITGETVRRFLVSRDGSRLVAVVRRGGADRILAARIRHNDRGRVVGLRAPVRLQTDTDGRPRVRDIAWRSETTVSVLSPVREFAQVRTTNVDGTPESSIVAPATLGGDFRRLAGSPVDIDDLFAVYPGFVTNLALTRRSTESADIETLTLTYPG